MTTFEVAIDNAKMQIHCNEVDPTPGPPPGTYTVDVPATAFDGAPAGNSIYWQHDALTNEGDANGFIGHTQINMSDWVATYMSSAKIATYGTGSNKLNWSLPVGATLVSMKYVIKAYREADLSATPGGATTVAAISAFGSCPSYQPAAVVYSAARSGVSVYFPALAVTTSWVDAYEVMVDEPNPTYVLANDAPLDTFSCVQADSTSSAVVKWDYLAVRITYTIP